MCYAYNSMAGYWAITLAAWQSQLSNTAKFIGVDLTRTHFVQVDNSSIAVATGHGGSCGLSGQTAVRPHHLELIWKKFARFGQLDEHLDLRRNENGRLQMQVSVDALLLVLIQSYRPTNAVRKVISRGFCILLFVLICLPWCVRLIARGTGGYVHVSTLKTPAPTVEEAEGLTFSYVLCARHPTAPWPPYRRTHPAMPRPLVCPLAY